MVNYYKPLTPFKSKKRKVRKGWIDYNGHMNVAYYTLAFDEAIDEFLEKEVGIGPSFIQEANQGSYALQTQYRYLKELLRDNYFYISIFVADFSAKRMHLMSEIIGVDSTEIYATCETVMVNVDLVKRRSCDYPKWASEKLLSLYIASKELRSSIIIGHSIGLKKNIS